LICPFVEQLFLDLIDNSRLASASLALKACPREAKVNVTSNHTQLPHGSQNQISHPLAARDAPASSFAFAVANAIEDPST